ncbi:hypothetical protein [Sulfitobacter sp. PS-8MA]|uniref:hypothetical protein n=1 Tax=Sulfitobacter sp. PS-8MA TaxID=3237707 RepID=UPI0034C6C67B
MSGNRHVIWLVDLTRALLLCAMLVFGLSPQAAEAHSPASGMGEGAASSMPHGEDHALISEAFEQCELGVDCALMAVPAEQIFALRFSPATATVFRHSPITRDGSGPAYEPPPPRLWV